MYSLIGNPFTLFPENSGKFLFSDSIRQLCTEMGLEVKPLHPGYALTDDSSNVSRDSIVA